MKININPLHYDVFFNKIIFLIILEEKNYKAKD